MGRKLGQKIAREWEDLDVDVVIPIPETSCDVALEIAGGKVAGESSGGAHRATITLPGNYGAASVRRDGKEIAAAVGGKPLALDLPAGEFSFTIEPR